MHPIAASFKIRCSAIKDIMTNPREKKSNLDKYNEAVQSKDAKIIEYEGLVNKETKKAQTLLEQIRRLDSAIKALEPVKDLPHLSQTTISYLKKWLKAVQWQRDSSFSNEYTEKGIKTEEDGITLIALVLKTGMIRKNSNRFEDEYKTGEPDVLVGKELVIDNKSSYSLDTFPMYDDELPDKGYEWQILGYMGLTGAKKGKVVYTLNNMPYSMLHSQLMKQAYYLEKDRYDHEGNTLYMTDDEKYEFVKNKMFTHKWKDVNGIECGFDMWYSSTFPDAKRTDFVEIPMEYRVKAYDVERDDERIKAIDERVIECRKYIDYLLKTKTNHETIETN